jgi:NAD(P)H-hydrate repair Nnr-like enzyme with NAD(P)H-hydrate epimerase domain
LLAVRSLSINQQFQGLAADKAIYRIQIVKITKNIGMLLLAVYLIIDGLLGFGLNLGPAIFLLYLVALAAGIFILIGK